MINSRTCVSLYLEHNAQHTHPSLQCITVMSLDIFKRDLFCSCTQGVCSRVKNEYPNSQQAPTTQQRIQPALHSEIFCTAVLKLKSKNETNKEEKLASAQQGILIKGWSTTSPASGQVPRKSLPLPQDYGSRADLQGRGSWFIMGLPLHGPYEPKAWSGLGHLTRSFVQMGVLDKVKHEPGAAVSHSGHTRNRARRTIPMVSKITQWGQHL